MRRRPPCGRVSFDDVRCQPQCGSRGLVDADREVALLLDIITATSSGPGVEPMAAAVAQMITAATASDVCFVHVLDDTDSSLTLAAPHRPSTSRSEWSECRLAQGFGLGRESPGSRW